MILSSCILLSICACTQNGPSQTVPSGPPASENSSEPAPSGTLEDAQLSQSAESFPLPGENIRAVSTALHGMPASTANGYYSVSTALKYTDIDSQQTVFLCSQPGCKHADASCQAWVGSSVESLCEYQGIIYAVTKEEDAIEFLKKDIATGKRTVLDRWELSGDEIPQISLGVFSDGKCALYISHNTSLLTESGDLLQSTITTEPLLYDLSTGAKTTLPEQYQNWSVWGICGSRLLMAHRDYRISEEEYTQWYGDDSGYEAYLESYIPSTLQLYDLETGESENIATEDEGLTMTADPCFAYGNTFIYQMGNDICLYNLETQTSRTAISAERVMNFWLMDHKIFLIQSLDETSEDECRICYMDMDGGELFRLNNEGATDYMHFSVTWEGNDFFGGNYKGNRLIRKADFYADHYDKSWVGGY